MQLIYHIILWNFKIWIINNPLCGVLLERGENLPVIDRYNVDMVINIWGIIIYNYCISLSAIWCVMEHWKAILTKAKGSAQYCFSVLHNTSNCTKWSAVIVLLHLTYQVFWQANNNKNQFWKYFKNLEFLTIILNN